MKGALCRPKPGKFTHVSGVAPAQYLLRPGWQPLSITRHVMWAARASSSTQVSDEALFLAAYKSSAWGRGLSVRVST